MSPISRRALLTAGVAAAGGSVVVAAAAIGRRLGLVPPDAAGIYGPGETLTYAAHRLLGRHARAREFPPDMISPRPFANAVIRRDAEFMAHQAAGFATWRVEVEGLIARPVSLSLAELRALPVSRQITELSCEEGWSYIAEWIGTPLAAVLDLAGVKSEARYVVYQSHDLDSYDSIDLDEAGHPQTLLAWGMNGADLPVPFGGPLRMRVPRQLGYKSTKFINRLVLTDTLADWGEGKGSIDADGGYSWYAGI
ncbi:MAG TPA: molybdopterin-dependent oxidoreductase [Vicinamibacterales bacterium]|jgi:DMSO/TMAO reductase YedYZ molybdopterin-dependent catalytic subunit